MDRPEKISLIARYDSAIDPLIDFVQDIPAAAIDFRPGLPGAWTIREHAVHILDGDTFGYGRIRLAVAQPDAEVFVWDEEAWQRLARYKGEEEHHHEVDEQRNRDADHVERQLHDFAALE